MTILTPQGKQIVPSDPSTAGERRGRRRHSQLINVKGIPRYDDLLTTRFLEQTPTVSLPMNTAKKQARAIPWSIEPTVDKPTATHNMMADRIAEFIDGNFNENGDTWDQFLGLMLNDSVSIDTGAAEFVPTESPVEHPQTGEPTYWLSEVYAVDGTIVSKNLDEHDRIPQPPEPAFFKWGNAPNVSANLFDASMYDRWFDRFKTGRLLSGARQRAVPMTRDEMAILETNSQPRELSAYGRGVVQQVRPWAEILLNQDQANVRHFSDDEYAKGILNIGEQYAGEIDTFRQYWEDEIKGSTESKLPKIASSNVEFIPFQETLKELQYLESQNWYSKLVWLLFGESTSTVGLAEDANTATAEAQSEDVFYNTTMPRLNALGEWMNKHWLPKMRAYWLADGELEFKFNFEEHPILADRERQKRRDDLNHSLKTPNEVREAEGNDPLPWGDVPSEAVNAFVRENPEWVMEEWGGVEGVPEPSSDDPGGLFSHSPRQSDGEGEKSLDASEAPAPSHTGNESEFKGSFGETEAEDDTNFRHTKTPEGIPDEAYPVDDAGECDGSTQEGPEGGLYCVPDDAVADSDEIEAVVEDLPDSFDGGDSQREQLSDGAKTLVESGATYSEAVNAIEDNVDGLDTEARRDIRRTAYANQETTTEIGGQEVAASPILKEAYDSDESPIRAASEGMLDDDFVEDPSFGPERHGSQPAFNSWREERDGSLLNGDTAELWGAAIDRYGNDSVPDNATADPDTVGEPLPVDEDMNADPVTAIGDSIQTTREVLSEVFGDSVPVARGVSGEFAEQIKAAKESGEAVELDHRALESWSTFPDHSEQFANEGDEPGVIITTEVPIEDVYGSSHTTPGLGEEENELIVGSDGPMEYSPDQIHIADDSGMIDSYDEVART